jgi:hypothetical protein
MRSPIEIELRMGGSAMLGMPPELASITLTLLRAWYVPSISMLILDPTNPRRSTLLISYDYLPDLINEFLT